MMLLVVGLSALLWTTAARPGPVPPNDILAMSAAPSCLAGDSTSPGDSDREWRAEHYAASAVTESLWKFAPVHAALAATRSARFDTAPSPSSPDPPVRSAPHYLRHTPLLI